MITVTVNTWPDFMDAVEDMRQAQREYFAGRGGRALNRAKAMEKIVDTVIAGHRIRQRSKGEPQLLLPLEQA
jgi:hypothetical protein